MNNKEAEVHKEKKKKRKKVKDKAIKIRATRKVREEIDTTKQGTEINYVIIWAIQKI